MSCLCSWFSLYHHSLCLSSLAGDYGFVNFIQKPHPCETGFLWSWCAPRPWNWMVCNPSNPCSQQPWASQNSHGLSSHVLNDSGVILSCGASLSLEDGRTATIYGSFLANLTMEIIATGTKGTLRVDDFVIPFQETEASFTTCTKAWFNKPVTAWVNPPSEQTVKTELPQEACMVKEFGTMSFPTPISLPGWLEKSRTRVQSLISFGQALARRHSWWLMLLKSQLIRTINRLIFLLVEKKGLLLWILCDV